MPDQDPYAQYAVSPSAVAPAAASSAADPYAKYAVSSSTSAPTQPQATPSQPADPYAKYAFGSPVSGKPQVGGPSLDSEDDGFTHEDPNDNWLQKSWKWSNEPLTESVLGWRQFRPEDPGWARALEKVGSSLTSPLSLGLFAAFAPAGLAEGVAGTALKEGLTEGEQFLGGEALSGAEAAVKVEDYGRAVAAAKKAQMAGSSIRDAVSSSTGGRMGETEFINFGQYLRNQGMVEDDILKEGLARRGVSRSLYAAGFSPDKALRIAKGAEAAVNAGFAWQQVQGAVYALPHFADALANGDYDHAQEYLVEGGLGGVFGLLGGAHALHSLSDVVPGINEKNFLPLSDATEGLKKLNGALDQMVAYSDSNNAERVRQQRTQMLDALGIPVPASLQKATWGEMGGFVPGLFKEIGSALGEILSSPEKKQKLEQGQLELLSALDVGNDPVAAHQMFMGLAHAYKLEDWAKENFPNFIPPVRTLEDISREEERGVLQAKGEVRVNRDYIKDLDSRIKVGELSLEGLQPENEDLRPKIQQQIQALNEEKNAAETKHVGLIEEQKRASLWESPVDDKGNPIEETPEQKEARLSKAFRSRYDFLYQQLREAARPIDRNGPNALDQFNDKVRALGWNPQDLKLIEEKYPQFLVPETGTQPGNFGEGFKPLPEGSYVKEEQPNPHNPDQKIYKMYDKDGGLLGFGYSPEDAEEDAITQFNKNIPTVSQKIHEARPDPAEINDLRKQITSLSDKFAQTEDTAKADQIVHTAATLQKRLNRLQGLDLGDVSQLKNGTKLIHLSRKALGAIQKLAGYDDVPSGTVFQKSVADRARKGLDSPKALKKLPEEFALTDEEAKSLGELLDKGRNENGDFTIQKDDGSRKSPRWYRLWTAREELNHHWQNMFGSDWINHLKEQDFKTLFDEMPGWMKDHLGNSESGYEKFPDFLKVIEASAKMLSAGDENFALTREEQRDYADLQKHEAKGRLGFAEEDRLKAFRDRLLVADQDSSDYLFKYFKAIEDLHGREAFDKLVHTTTKARRIKQEFLNATKTTDNTNGQPVEGNVGGVQAGGSGGNSQGPPKPPYEPPDWDRPDHPDWWRGSAGHATAYANEPWLTGPLHPSLPRNIVSEVNKARLRNPDQKNVEYVQNFMKALHSVSQGLDTKKLALYKTLRDADDDNWTVGYTKGIIKSMVENHIRHIWGEDPKKGYPVLEHAGAGTFAINATQARHRSWGTIFEGVLQGRQLKVHDPIAIIANDSHQIARAAATREFLLKLRELRDPEGMPAAVFPGMGREVPSEDGTKSSILVNPNVIRNVEMTPQEAKYLRDAGLLKTYLADGRVVDHTPKVTQDNVKAWIESTKKKLDKMLTSNPLFVERQRHEEGWKNLQEFAKSQSQKISDYLDKALQQVKDNGSADGKNYQGLPETNKPTDFNMAGYLDDVLHGRVNGGKITPEDLRRLEQYAQRNKLYAEHKSSSGFGTEDYKEHGIRPGEVARILTQEQSHLKKVPGLSEYLNEFHDLYSRDKQGNVLRGKEGELTRHGTGQAVKYISHAAEDPAYPQLIQDKFNLLRADNLLSSNPLTREHPETKAEIEKLFEDINSRQQKQYLWSPKTHIPVNHPSFHGFRWMATSADGTPTLAESDMAISRHYYPYLVNRLGLEPSKLREAKGLGKITAPLLKTGGRLKSIILSGSPFHLMQIALRGLMLHVNPFVRPNPLRDLNETFESVADSNGKMRTPTLGDGIRNSLTLFLNQHHAEDYAVGVASHVGKDSVLRKIPVVNQYIRISDQIHDLLFNRFIPSVKADAFKQMFNEYAKAHPDWTDDAIAYKAAQHTNNAFGGINWKEMGRSATTQDWFHLIALAPDWLESEMRFAAGIFKGAGIGPAKYEPEEGKNFTRTQVAQTAVALWTIARVVNQLYSGSPHYEAPFGLATKDKDGREVVYSVRTMPTDILSMATSPGNFLNSRMSPFLRSEEELRTGRNSYDQKLTDGEKYVDLVSNLVPIWGQANLKQISNLSTAADVGTPQQIAKSLGATASIYRTSGQLMAAKLASERSEGGPINQAQISRHRLLLQLEDNLRNGQIDVKALERMVDEGNLPESDAKTIISNVRSTQGEDPELARMYSRVSRLDFAGALSVYQESNSEEKAILDKLLVKKARRYIKKSLTDETPDTRALDPYFKYARRLAPLEGETTE